MLKGIPSVISPDLMSVLMRMGHGDDLVLADGNFPAESHARNIIRADGHMVTMVLDVVLRFFPLDTAVDYPVRVMSPTAANAPEPAIWSDFRSLLLKHERRPVPLYPLERFEFYDLTKQAFAVVATGETALFANVILKKGVVTE